MKPIVQYTLVVGDIKQGRSVLVRTLDHPSPLVTNTVLARTSEIMSVYDNGCFKTQNTMYVPFEGNRA